MSEEFIDPRLKALAHALHHKVSLICAGQSLTKGIIEKIDDCMRDHRRKARLEGIRFPSMVCVIMDKHGAIEIFRRNLQPVVIDRLILGLAKKFPDADAGEIARAIQRAWPTHRCDPSQIVRQG